MTKTEFYLDRHRRALEKAHRSILIDRTDLSRMYTSAARHYHSATMVASGRASTYDDMIEILNCEIESHICGNDAYSIDKYVPGLQEALRLVINNKMRDTLYE